MAVSTRRQFKGAAVSTTTTSTLASGDTGVTIAATTGWPSGAGSFYVVLEPSTSAEEKCRCTISGSTLTLTRAADNTTAVAHASGSTIYPCATAVDFDEANLMASVLNVTAGAALTLPTGTDTLVGRATTDTLTNKTLATPLWNIDGTAAAAPTIASATTIAPTTRIAFVSGTTDIVTITAPTGIAAGGGSIILIPTGLWITTTAGNIAIASRAVVSKPIAFTFDVTTTKWYPSDVPLAAGVATFLATPSSANLAAALTDETGSGALNFGSTAAPTSRVWLHTHNGYGSTNTKIPRFTTTVINSGTDITYADSATLGTTFTINTAGMYAMSYQMGSPISTQTVVGISLNSAQLTTNVISITVANRLGVNKAALESGDTVIGYVATSFYLAVNDVIRPHTHGHVPNTNSESMFTIVRLN